jgi:transcriptional regulator with XRE-family HTH domain
MSNQLAAKLRAARQSAQLTQAQIAEAVGVTRGAVTQWESKDPETRTTPSIELIRKFAERTGLPFSWLINDQFKPEDVHLVRAQLRAGKWHEVEITETVSVSDQLEARAKVVLQPKLVTPPATVEEPPPPSRRAMLFWRAVEFEVCNTRPEFECFFEAPLQRGALHLYADFYTGDVVAEFSTMHHQHPQPFIRRKLADLALIEQIVGRPIKKLLLLWLPLPDTPPPDLAEMAASVGVDVRYFRDPHDAAQFLLQLEPAAA